MFKVPDDPHAELRQWLNHGVFCDEQGQAYLFETLMGDAATAVGIPIPRIRDNREGASTQHLHRRDMYLHWPLCGAVNNVDHRFAMVVRRLARRQYARTFCYNQVEIQVPRIWEVLHESGKREPPRAQHMDVLRALFYPMYPASLAEAEKMLNEGWVSVALTRRITIVRAEGKALVYDGMTHAGHILDGRYIPSVTHHHAMKVLKAFKGELQL